MFGILGAGLDFLSNIPRMMHDEEMQNDAQQFNAGEAAVTRNFNSAQAVAQRDWQERMRATQYQTTVSDLAAAGLNPMLAYHQGGAGTPSGGAASSSPASSGITSGGSHPAQFMAAAQSASQIELNKAAEDRTKAEADRARAETTEIQERTPTHAVSIDKMRQQIEESKTLIQKMIQETSTSAFSAAHLQQQAINLKALLPQISATVDQLRAQTKLTTAETHLTHEKSGLTMHQEAEIRQRIKANLPAAEAALKDLERIARELDMPRRQQESISHDRFVGSLGALLRTLTGLGTYLPRY